MIIIGGLFAYYITSQVKNNFVKPTKVRILQSLLPPTPANYSNQNVSFYLLAASLFEATKAQTILLLKLFPMVTFNATFFD